MLHSPEAAWPANIKPRQPRASMHSHKPYLWNTMSRLHEYGRICMEPNVPVVCFTQCVGVLVPLPHFAVEQ